MQSINKLSFLLVILLVGTILLTSAPVNVGAQTQDFIISVSPSRVTIGTDGIARYSIRLTSINGFAGTIQLDVKGISTTSYFQASYSFDPSIVNLAADSDVYSVLTIMVASQSYYYNTYTYTQYPSYYSYNIYTMSLTIVATSGGITKNVPVIANVYYGNSLSQPDLTIDLQPGNILTSGDITRARNETLRLAVTATGYSSYYNYTYYQNQQYPSNFLFTVTPQFYDAPQGFYVSFSPTGQQVKVGQTVQFTATVLMTPEFLLKSGTYKFAVGINAILPSSYSYYSNLVVTKVAIATIVVPPYFSISANPSILNVYIGGNQDQKMQIVITPVSRGLNQPVRLTVQGIPSGLIATFQNDILVPQGTAPLTTNLVFSAPSTYESKIYPILIIAETSGISRTVNASIYLRPFGDYLLTLQQTTIVLNARGDSKSIMLTVTPQGGFRSTIYFSVSQLPAGITANFSNPTATIQTDQPITMVLTLTAQQNAAPGTYSVAIISGTGLSTKTVILTLLIRSGIYETWPIILIVIAIIAAVTIVVFVGFPKRGGRHVYVLKQDEKKLLPEDERKRLQ